MEFVNSFSVWVILGAPICFVFFSLLFNVSISWYAALCLSLAIWVIYTLDHIIDGNIKKEESLSLRHYIHFKYRKQLLIISAILTLAGGVLAFSFLQRNLWQFGLLLGLGLLAYFALNRLFFALSRRNLPLKEVAIAGVVSYCFAGIPSQLAQGFDHTDQLLLILAFFGINLSNLLMFSYYDYEQDRLNALSSIGQTVSAKGIRMLGSALLMVSMPILLVLGVRASFELFSMVVLLLMAVQLLIILWLPSIFKPAERFRFWGDLIYIYPIAYVLLAKL